MLPHIISPIGKTQWHDEYRRLSDARQHPPVELKLGAYTAFHNNVPQ